MAMSDYTALIAALKTFPSSNSDNTCRRNYSSARQLLQNSELNETDRNVTFKVLSTSGDSNGGYFCCSDGVHELIQHLDALHEQSQQTEALTVPAFNLRNLTALVSDGQIFTVKFIKRGTQKTTGELRRMNCRIGVTKHLKGDKKAYNAAQKRLLSVFDSKRLVIVLFL